MYNYIFPVLSIFFFFANFSFLYGAKFKALNANKVSFTALDPAGPLFHAFSSRLNSFDANFVDVIHTDSYILGLSKQVGHVDFYPNNGRRPQPGCPLISTLFFST